MAGTVKHVRVIFDVDTAKLQQSDAIIKQIAKDLGATEDEVRAVSNEFNKQPGIVNRIEKQVKQLRDAQQKANDPKKVQQYTKEIHNLETELRKLTTVQTRASGAFSSMGGIVRSLGPALGITLGVGAVVAFGKSAITLAGQMETLRVSFDVLLGSAEKSKKLLEELEAFANTTPFEFPEIAALGKKLLAVGVPAGQVTDSIRRIGELSAASGQPLERLGIIYAQVMAKGRLQGEENMQLLEAGISLNKELAQVTGISGAALEKAMSAGKISAEDFNKALKIATSEGGRFFGLIDKQSQTFEGKMSTMSDAWGKFMRTIGESVALKGLIDDVTKTIEGLRLLFIGEAARGAEQHAKVVDHIAIKYKEIADEARSIALEGGLSPDAADEKALNELTRQQEILLKQTRELQAANAARKEELEKNKSFLPYREEQDAIDAVTEALGENIASTRKQIEAIEKVKAAIISSVVERDKAKFAAKEEKKEVDFLTGSLGDLENQIKELTEIQTGKTVLGSELYFETGKKIEELENKIIRLKQTIDHAKLNEVTGMNIVQTDDSDVMEPIIKRIEETKELNREAADDISKIYESSNDVTQDVILTKQKETTEELVAFNISEKEKEEDIKRRIAEDSVQLANDLLDLAAQQNQQRHDAEINRITDRYNYEIQQAGRNTVLKLQAEKKFAAEKRKIDIETANRSKAIAIAQAIINGAVGITTIIAQNGITPLTAVLIALEAVLVGVQIAAIASQKASFAKGGYTGKGGNRDHTGERVAGTVHEKEFVFNKKTTKEWFPIFQKIHTGELKKDAFVQTLSKEGEVNFTATMSDKNMVKKMDKTNSLLEQLVNQKQSYESNYTERRRLFN